MTMELNPVDIELSDLPRIIEIKVPADASDSDIQQMIEDLRGQVIYNSRFEESSMERELKIELIKKVGEIVQLKIS